MTFELPKNISWTRYERFLTKPEVLKTGIGRFLWNIHTFIWQSNIVKRALKDLRITAVPDTSEKAKAIVSKIFRMCHFVGTWKAYVKWISISEQLTKKIQTVATRVSAALPTNPLSSSKEKLEGIELMRDPLKAFFKDIANGEKIADLLCDKIIPKESIQSVTLQTTPSGVRFKIVLKNPNSTTLSDRAKSYVISEAPWYVRSLTTSLIKNITFRVCEQICGLIDLQNSRITFEDPAPTGHLSGRFRRTLLSIEPLPLENLGVKISLTRTAKPEELTIYSFNYEQLYEIFRDFSWDPKEQPITSVQDPAPSLPKT